MIIQSARNPQYTSDGGIDLVVKFDHIDFEVPFHATPHDSEEHGRELYQMASDGMFGEIAPYIKPEEPLETVLTRKLDEIQTEKKRVCDSGVTVNGILFDTDERARLAYLEFFGMVGANPGYTVSSWKASGSTFVEMTPSLFYEVVAARTAQESAAFAWQKQAIEEVEYLASRNEIRLLDDYVVAFQSPVYPSSS